ncbi:MAG: site-specific integrase [Anaerolineales bacterium]|nr:site-specific integrase [Anaerolineales bacterium]
MLLEDRFSEFIETCRGQSECNRRNYRQRLSGFLAVHGAKPASACTPADVNTWHRELQKRGLAPATLAGYRQALKAFFNYCVQVGDIPRSPAAHLTIGSFSTSRRDKLPHEPDVQAVTAVAREWSGSDIPQRVRDGLIWLLSLQSGARLGEIRNLRLEDIVTSLRIGPDGFGVYRVPSLGKTGRVYIRFAGDIADAFTLWLRLRPASSAPECFIATRPARKVNGNDLQYCALTRSAATYIYVRICAAAGVQPPILSHALRHRLGHLTTHQFGPKIAAILLNHRDWQQPTTAMAFYYHPDEDDASRAVMSSVDSRSDVNELRQMRRLFGLDET